MQDMWDMWDICQYARYVPIYTDMGGFLQGMSTHIDMKKLAENGAYYQKNNIRVDNIVQEEYRI